MPIQKTHLIKIEIAGLINSPVYQKTRLYVEGLVNHLPHIYLPPTINGMLEFDWDEYLTKKRRTYGVPYWLLTRPVMVNYDGEFIGSDIEFMDLINHKFKYTMPVVNNYYCEAVFDDYHRHFTKSYRTFAVLHIKIDNEVIGFLTFQLYSDLLPITCENFKYLLTGEKGVSKDCITLCYTETRIHRVVKSGWIQGGDIENITGGGGVGAICRTIPDENYCISHDRRGVLSMANRGKHTNASQFFITLKPSTWMDYYYVAFGQLIEGVETLKIIENVETKYEKPLKDIVIVECEVVVSEGPLDKPCLAKLIRDDKGIKTPEMKEQELLGWQEDVLDERDVESVLEYERYLKGLYGLDMSKYIELTGIQPLKISITDFIDDPAEYSARKILKELAYTACDITETARDLINELVGTAESQINDTEERKLDKVGFLSRADLEYIYGKDVYRVKEKVALNIVEAILNTARNVVETAMLITDEIINATLDSVFSTQPEMSKTGIEMADEVIRGTLHSIFPETSAIQMADDVMRSTIHSIIPETSAIQMVGDVMRTTLHSIFPDELDTTSQTSKNTHMASIVTGLVETAEESTADNTRIETTEDDTTEAEVTVVNAIADTDVDATGVETTKVDNTAEEATTGVAATGKTTGGKASEETGIDSMGEETLGVDTAQVEAIAVVDTGEEGVDTKAVEATGVDITEPANMDSEELVDSAIPVNTPDIPQQSMDNPDPVTEPVVHEDDDHNADTAPDTSDPDTTPS